MTFGLDTVTVRFGDSVAVNNITMEVKRGEVTAIVGADGSGKSTTLRTMAGLSKISHGTVITPDWGKIGYLPTGAGSWANLTVDENVSFVGGVYGLRGDNLTKRANALLGSSGLMDARDRLASQLSGGMRNKLGFCLAMLSRPTLLILDEPTTGVDPVSRVDLWRLISETAAGGAAVLMATTYMDEAERAASVSLLERGRLLLQGSPDSLLASLRGDIVAVDRADNSALAWRYGAGFHEWYPDGAPPQAHKVKADLTDVSVVAQLGADAHSVQEGSR